MMNGRRIRPHRRQPCAYVLSLLAKIAKECWWRHVPTEPRPRRGWFAADRLRQSVEALQQEREADCDDEVVRGPALGVDDDTK
jgi:hypothetical protein